MVSLDIMAVRSVKPKPPLKLMLLLGMVCMLTILMLDIMALHTGDARSVKLKPHLKLMPMLGMVCMLTILMLDIMALHTGDARSVKPKQPLKLMLMLGMVHILTILMVDIMAVSTRKLVTWNTSGIQYRADATSELHATSCSLID